MNTPSSLFTTLPSWTAPRKFRVGPPHTVMIAETEHSTGMVIVETLKADPNRPSLIAGHSVASIHFRPVDVALFTEDPYPSVMGNGETPEAAIWNLKALVHTASELVGSSDSANPYSERDEQPEPVEARCKEIQNLLKMVELRGPDAEGLPEPTRLGLSDVHLTDEVAQIYLNEYEFPADEDLPLLRAYALASSRSVLGRLSISSVGTEADSASIIPYLREVVGIMRGAFERLLETRDLTTCFTVT